ncbi:MAG: 23S rRNA (pseudouridine(1915)-N(3))-methyltransferase RlmH [Prevotellaceae bacterium]|jgi:23S rRNA (pseudouridine1915-N3)-methyltransferase|nr:23S rRNA (pseudouridine(1915)-N(3))-methyltransferase RlmH [Prevotellaceae bacterium]
MKIKFIVVGKTDAKYIQEAVSVYLDRLGHYVPFEMHCIPDPKNAGKMNELQLKTQEATAILECLSAGDELILLDEKGETLSSVEFASMISKKINYGVRRLVFVSGGPYGFADAIYEKSSLLLSLSKMTFTHQMVRLIFVEQLYRAFTIIKGEKYHH